MDLPTLWFMLWGILWAVYFMLDGYDFGAGMLVLFLGRNEPEKRLIVRTIGPVWSGNEVWLIAAGGVTFAAFPAAYALMFSYLYLPLLFILFALIFRGVALEFRGKTELPGWQQACDTALFLGSALPSLLFGVAFGNIFQGLPFDATGYHGNLLTLLNPYSMLTGILFLLLFLMHGSVYLAMKTEGTLQLRAAGFGSKLWAGLLFAAAIFLPATHFRTDLYLNYMHSPLLSILPAAAVASLITGRLYLAKAGYTGAFFASCLTVLFFIFFGVVGLYPRLLPSSLDPNYSLNIANAASGSYTLMVMTIVALIFIPVVVAYQIWVQRIFRGVVEAKDTGEY
ncbi:MAG: cytochrome d ubiquinol oxidase subunit II [Thermodesulfovibrio sp.]|nr:cytochrome d ubiquinol oxidase subunit II [Thermodesulfovibrio sp.]